MTNQPIHAKKIGNYVTGKQLGKGSFGDVRQATHTLTGSTVAVKILEKERIKTELDFQRVIREIQILKLLQNDHIVKLYEVIDTSRNVYIVTEFIEGGELFGVVERRVKLTEPEACKYFRQMCSAVQYCHSHKICHRDLKLENILVTKEDNVKIIDFGLSNILAADYKLKTQCGSPSYASPEMLLGKKYDGPAIDVWALGIILFAMVCGYLPFDDDEQPLLYKKIIKGDFHIPSHVSPLLTDLLRKIIVVDPLRRIQMEDVFRHPWFVQTCADPIPSFVDTPKELIDFKIIYYIGKAYKELRPLHLV